MKTPIQKYIAYYRVSTEEQGKSGLGLQAQQKSITNFCNDNGILLEEYQDIESGTNNNRTGLFNAITACKANKATLVIKELSRLTRAGQEIPILLERQGVEYISSESPLDTEVIKDIKIALAKEERRNISHKTKAALSVINDTIKKEGFYTTKAGRVIYTLGNSKNLSGKATQNSVQARKKIARENKNNKGAYNMISVIRSENPGKSYYSIKKSLNEYGMRTSKGGEFSTGQVIRLIKLYEKQT